MTIESIRQEAIIPPAIFDERISSLDHEEDVLH